MRADRPIPPRANDGPASPPAAPPWSNWYKLIIGRCMAFSEPTILGLLMVILLSIPARTPPELGLNPGSSLWSLNISTSHSELITVEYSHVKLLSSFDGQLSVSRPSIVSAFTEGPGCVTSVRAKAQSTLAIVTDLGVNGLVSTLSGAEVAIDVAVKAKRRLCLGPWWVAVLDVDVSFTGSNSAAPTDGKGGGGWMILGGTLSCSLDIIPQLCITNFLEPPPPGCGGDDWSSRAGEERGGHVVLDPLQNSPASLAGPSKKRDARYGRRKYMMRKWIGAWPF